MFRRFIIVCWVLFSLGAVTGLVGLAGYQYYDVKAEAFAERQRAAGEPPQITNLDDAAFVARKIKDGTLKGERRKIALQALREFLQAQGLEQGTETPRQELERLRAEQGALPALPDGFVLDEQLPLEEVGVIEAVIELERRNRVRMEAFGIVGAIGGILAGLFLVWNMIWHTGHWVWMGRKVEAEK